MHFHDALNVYTRSRYTLSTLAIEDNMNTDDKALAEAFADAVDGSVEPIDNPNTALLQVRVRSGEEIGYRLSLPDGEGKNFKTIELAAQFALTEHLTVEPAAEYESPPVRPIRWDDVRADGYYPPDTETWQKMQAALNPTQ